MSLSLIDNNFFIQKLEHYCRIFSGTSNFYGVNEAQMYLRTQLETLGFVCELIENPSPKKSGNLLIGRRFVSQQAPTVLLISHADTLDGNELDLNRYQLELTDKKIIGQGVLDDKASQFVALRGIAEYLQQQTPPKLNFIFISSPNEELGSYGFHTFFEQISQEADLALGFEPALEGKDIVVSRRGNRWYDLHITGREAHAGRAHKHGLNAAHELAHIIVRLHGLTSYKNDVTVNVGQITSSSQTYNVVCGLASAKIDTRFSTLKDRDSLHQKIIKAFEKHNIKAQSDKLKCSIQWEIADDCPPLHPNKDSLKWAKHYTQIISNIESRNVIARGSGGGADVCYLNREGLIVIDGLGACGEAMHRNDECVYIDSLWSRSRALSRFLRDYTHS